MLDEINTDVLERSYFWDDRKPLGAFSAAFTTKVRSNLLALAKAGTAAVVDRMKSRALFDLSDARCLAFYAS